MNCRKPQPGKFSASSSVLEGERFGRRRPPPRWRLCWTLALALGLASAGAARENLPTPLEAANFSRISSSAEITRYLQQLGASSALAHLEVLGFSVQGRPLEALVLGARQGAPRLKILLIGSQHGAAEPAGGEALLQLGRELLSGPWQARLAHTQIILLPNANPDGRDLKRRANAHGINLNTNFVLANEPETLVLKQALRRYAPDVVLDSHESAIFKPKTLAREGYLTDFQAQFEVANHPAMPATMQAYQRELLTQWLAQVRGQQLAASHYLSEITSIHQPLTHGGLTMRNFRNAAGMTGALSFLLETRLDPPSGSYPTYRNIAARVAKQMICLREFLALIHAHRAEIPRRVAAHRAAFQNARVVLFARYVVAPEHPQTSVPLRRIDTGERVVVAFSDHRQIALADTITRPRGYVVTAHTRELGELLGRHGIEYAALGARRALRVVASHFEVAPAASGRARLTRARAKTISAPSGALTIDLSQANGRLAVVLLDPRSASSVFRTPPGADWMRPEQEFFVYAMVDHAAKF